ncbi:hypothetical protein BC936DRAFT_140846 [Jimgerdemannia flammicorona]|uniref:Uncharacterized protein n=1 Tax=Jimgerdemannia flammicorona TaxID=994334 RepID=A0A433A3B5_9FUNG|nr:hypothetical protein BC936DRAFT_140846 [Jimgerdemannia flammicorona]
MHVSTPSHLFDHTAHISNTSFSLQYLSSMALPSRLLTRSSELCLPPALPTPSSAYSGTSVTWVWVCKSAIRGRISSFPSTIVAMSPFHHSRE